MIRPIALLCLPVLLYGQPTDTTSYPLSTTAEPLTVTASRIPHGELATIRLSQLDIYRNATAKADPLLAVNTLPAATNPDETANVSLRGSPAEATGIYLNGVPLRSAVRIDQSNGVGQFSLFRQLPLRQLRVYPSNPPLQFSQASAGAVAIETDYARPGGTARSLSLNLVGVGYSHVQAVGETGALRGYVNASDLTAFRAVNGRKLTDLRASRSVDAMLSYAVKDKQQRTLQLFYLGFLESYRYDYRGADTAGQFGQRKPRHLGIVNYDWQGSGWTWRASQLLDWEKPTFAFDGQTLVVERFTSHTGIHAERRTPGLTLQWGGATNHYFDPGGHTHTTEAYAYVQHRTGPWLLGGGLKPVYADGAALNVQLAGRLELGRSRIHLTAGSHTQLLAPGPNFLGWQRLRIRQLAVDYLRRWSDWELEAAAYTKRERYGNRQTVAVAGAETQLTYRSGNWLVGLGLVTVRSRAETVPTRRDIPLSGRGRLQWNAAGWSAGLHYRARSGKVEESLMPGTVPDRYPDYQRLDASITKTLITKLGGVILYANANNLLDTRNVSYYSYRGEEYYSRRVVFFGAILSW
ncbi:hypothetical protein LEM8419_02783 [Neolewinella maritima]|uniref:TonB-dependent receptor n=1 Tax=Neolewinella maritima TaxID=1383882 RepID=A0ABM9B406_9BACT|nr:hypothetical protein [Neolewinella maritima]CAH1001875.1 hypothetical protein LEM8419_02783 [Neolewinella maritima]